MTQRKRVDGNQPDILDHLYRLGGTNQSLTDVGGGCPDQLLAFPGFTILGRNVTLAEVMKRLAGLDVIVLDGANVLAEIKQPGEGLRPNQEKWHETWRYYGGQVSVIKSQSDLSKLLTGRII